MNKTNRMLSRIHRFILLKKTKPVYGSKIFEDYYKSLSKIKETE